MHSPDRDKENDKLKENQAIGGEPQGEVENSGPNTDPLSGPALTEPFVVPSLGRPIFFEEGSLAPIPALERAAEQDRPLFGGFRPILGHPAAGEEKLALATLVAVMQRRGPAPDPDEAAGIVRILAAATFPEGGEGGLLTEKLIGALLSGNLDSFGVEDRKRFAELSAEREFPKESGGADLHRRWILDDVSKREAWELEVRLAFKGVGLHEVVPRSLWIRGEAREGQLESLDDALLGRFFDSPEPDQNPPASEPS